MTDAERGLIGNLTAAARAWLGRGATPVMALLYAALGLKTLSYLVFLPAVAFAIAVYGVYWTADTNRHRRTVMFWTDANPAVPAQSRV